MKRVFCLIIICAFASTTGASLTLAQSGRTKRTEPPKEERAEKVETKDEAKGETKDEAKDRSQDGAQANDDKPLTGKEVTVRAVVKSKPNPGYPTGARAYILGSDGRVRDEIDVLEGLPHGVTDEAIKAARRIEFEPARKDGRPVSQYVTVIYHFNLH
jgi:outer membrane biosynthesis protein TonB